MAQRSISNSEFLNSVKGNAKAKPAAMADLVQGGPAMDDIAARQAILKKGPFLNATPKFSSGPKASLPAFPALSEDERKAP